MNPLFTYFLGLVMGVLLVLLHPSITNSFKVDSQKEYLLRSYALETERIKAQTDLEYVKAIELSCTAEFINQYGEVYSRGD